MPRRLSRQGQISGRLQIAGEAQAIRFVRFPAVLQGNEKITSGSCLATYPLKHVDALLLRANVPFEQLKLRVSLRDLTLEPLSASPGRAEQTITPNTFCCCHPKTQTPEYPQQPPLSD